MSIARAFTIRHKESPPQNLHIGRAASQRNGRAIHRSQISSPVALVSSTNSLSFDAPDIAGTRPIRYRDFSGSSNSSHAADDSDASTVDLGNTTDASSIDGGASPTSPEPEPNHLSCYFKPAVDTKTPNRSPSTSAHSSGTFDAPIIPQRVPSHSKKAHEFLHRKRSVQRLMSPPASLVRRNSSEMFGQDAYTPPAEKANPFGNELAQLDEVQEELSHAVRDAEADADFSVMQSRGLASYGASDYLSEIQSMIYETFMVEEPVWI